MEALRTELEGQRLILSVERLDFTKGILEKLDAYERLLIEHPELKEKVIPTKSKGYWARFECSPTR